MPITRRCLVAFLAILCFVLAGCGSLSSRRGVQAPAPEEEDAGARQTATAQAHYGTGVIREMNGETEQALEEYEEAAATDPGNEWLVLEVSRRFIQNKKLDKAADILARSGALPNPSGSVLARLGFVYSQLGKTDQAIAASKAAIRRSPDALAGYHNLFLIQVQKKQPEDALHTLDEAARQAKSNPEFLIGLSELYHHLGVQTPKLRKTADEKALALLRRAEGLKLDSLLLKVKLADGFNLLGDSQKAAQIYLDLLKTMPSVPMMREQIHAKLADIYLRSSDRKRAIEQLEAIVRADPTNPLAYYYLGNIAMDEKRPADAADHLSKAILLSPEFEQAYFDLASAQLGAEKTSDALATLEKARQKFKQSFTLEMLSGIAYSQQKAYTEALRHFTAAEIVAKAGDPKRLNQHFYFQVGATCERKGDYAEAEKYFQQALKITPDFAEAQNYLGYMWAERGEKLEQSRELIEKAVKAQPKNAAYLDSLGWVLFKLGKPEEALPHILKAVELSEKPDATLFDHLGDIYQALKQPEKAREAWTKSLELEPSDSIKKKLEGNQQP